MAKNIKKKRQESSSQNYLIRFSQGIYGYAIQTGKDTPFVLLVQKRKDGKKWTPDITSVEDILALGGTKGMFTLNARAATLSLADDKMSTLLRSCKNMDPTLWRDWQKQRKKKSPQKNLKPLLKNIKT